MGTNPRARLDTKRAQAVRARLHAGHTVEELMQAVDGAKLGAFISDNGKRHDELELIMRDEDYLTDGSSTIMGYQAALVLRDERGEFEVANAFGMASGSSVLNFVRIQDACLARRKESGPRGRPVY